jgi:uncharacterized protein
MSRDLFLEHAEHAKRMFRFQSLHHGFAHWERVYDNAVSLGTQADMLVVALFAAYHDAWRRDDGHDYDHGVRAAQHIWAHLRTLGQRLTDSQLAILQFAIRYHSDGFTSDDITIGTCWDADRLDLPRVGTVPRIEYMSTPAGESRVLVEGT